MLDLFTIFTKGGIVLWYFQGTALSLSPAVNSLVKTVLLQERGSMDVFNHESLKLQFKLDNEFELVFVVVYQRILQLSYMDKLIDQVYIAFRDRYKTHLSSNGSLPCPAHYDDFSDIFKTILDNLEQEHKLINQRPREMKQWDGGSRKKDKKFINGVNDISTNSLGGQRDEDTMEENGGVAAVSTSLPPSNKLKKLMAARNGSKSGGGGTNKGKKYRINASMVCIIIIIIEGEGGRWYHLVHPRRRHGNGWVWLVRTRLRAWIILMELMVMIWETHSHL
jgi:hypothetical protein